MPSTTRKSPVVATIIIDEWAERKFLLPSTGRRRPTSDQAEAQFRRAIRRATSSVALVISQAKAQHVATFVAGFLAHQPEFRAAFRVREVRLKRFSNREQFIIQFRWYVTQHPYKQPARSR